jgi:phosphopantothenoylcysteine decarboxylase / phosphopantothenate---cysteine ligase
MARILITSGPTRQYLDPIRYLTNGSSGRMGAALAQSALDLGHQVEIVTGLVAIEYPKGARITNIISTEELLEACLKLFPGCDGLIAAAAPCDYRPRVVETHKIAKTGDPLRLELIETEDVAATLGAQKKPGQWTVGFALETDDARFKAITKLEKKNCDLIVLNGPQAMDSMDNEVEVLDKSGATAGQFSGSKEEVARGILRVISQRLIASDSDR